jgi:hypothetical protein
MQLCEISGCDKKALVKCPLCEHWICVLHSDMVGCVIRLCLICHEAMSEILDNADNSELALY